MTEVHHALFAYYEIFGIIYINKSTNLWSCIHSALLKNHGCYHADNMLICSELHFNFFQFPQYLLSLSLGCSFLSRGCSLSHLSPLSIYPVVCCRIHARRIFFFDDGVNMDWSCCRCPSIVFDMLVLLFVHASGFVHSSFICCNVL
jgi:hypothetical protein